MTKEDLLALLGEYPKISLDHLPFSNMPRSYFGDVCIKLGEMVAEGLVRIDDHWVRLSPKGRQQLEEAA